MTLQTVPQLRAGQVQGAYALNKGHFAGKALTDTVSIASTYAANTRPLEPEAPLDTAMLRRSPQNYVLDKAESGLYASMFVPRTGEFSLDHGVADNDAARVRWQILHKDETVVAKLWEHRESINAILGMSGYGEDGNRNVSLQARIDDGTIVLTDVYRGREPIILRVRPPRRPVYESQLSAIA